jgi:solute carrier family 45, member 1/2/4
MTVRRFWIASHLLFAGLMWSTCFISNVEGAVAMVAIAGISWALTLWAPFALIAHCVSHIQDVSRRESLASSRRASQASSRSGTPDLRPADGSPYGTMRRFSDRAPPHTHAHVGSGISITEDRRPSISTPLLAPEPRSQSHEIQRSLFSPPSPSPLKPEKKEITSAGAIMGLHNVFISSPQFISTLLASVMFHFLGAGGRGDDIGPNSTEPSTSDGWGGGSIAWVLRVGGLGGLVAAYLAWRLKEENEELGEEVFPPE